MVNSNDASGNIESDHPSILILEDDELVRNLLVEALKDQDLRISEAATVAEAKKLLDEQRFDLAILDIYLPDGKGLEIARKAKSIDCRLPVIIITGTPGGENLKESLDINVDNYLVKPVDIRQLQALVKYLIEAREKAEG